MIKRLAVALVLFASLWAVAQPVLAWDCSKPINYGQGECGYPSPTPTPKPKHSYPTATPVPPTVVPTVVPTTGPTVAPTDVPTSAPTVIPPTAVPTVLVPQSVPTTVPVLTATATPGQPAVSAQPVPAAPGPPASTRYTNVCVYTLESGQVRVDVHSVRDADRWLREHLDRADLPNDFVPATGQMCGITLQMPAATRAPVTVVPTAVPALVSSPVPVPAEATPAPSEQPISAAQCWQLNEDGTIYYNENGAPVACSTPAPEPVPPPAPTGLPNTGDPDALNYCQHPDLDWWQVIGQFIC